MNLKNHSTIALGYFLIIAFLGVLLRLFHVIDVPINYKHIVHAHSHIALLGWIYTAITTLIYYAYLREKPISKKYKKLFWITQFTLIGMLISFPITGYALLSILFSTLFLIASYWFFWFANKHISTEQKKTNSFKLVKAGLWFMILSSIGPWSLGIIMNTLGGASIWYRISIYFYLHFQYNGWFIVTFFGLFFYILEQQNIKVSKNLFKQFYWLLIVSIILTFFLSVLWTKPHTIFYTLGTIGALLQFLSFWYFIKLLKPIKLAAIFSKNILNLLILVGFLFVIKMTLQLVGSVPFFADSIATNIDLVIGYIHWTFLGVVSIAILGFLKHFKMIRLTKKVYHLYLIGFILTEGLIFYKGITHWIKGVVIEKYDVYLAAVSTWFFIAIALIFLMQFKKSKTFEKQI